MCLPSGHHGHGQISCLNGCLNVNFHWTTMISMVDSLFHSAWFLEGRIWHCSGVGNCSFFWGILNITLYICWKLYLPKLGDIQLGHLPTPVFLWFQGRNQSPSARCVRRPAALSDVEDTGDQQSHRAAVLNAMDVYFSFGKNAAGFTWIERFGCSPSKWRQWL